MAVHALLAGVFAQTCVSMLPPPKLEIEWFSSGREYAVDIPLRSSRTERIYRREHANGRTAERALSCITTRGVTYLTEKVGAVTTVRIPLALKPGESRDVEGATVRRIDPPEGAAPRSLWFSVSNPGVRLYGVQAGIGLAEVRMASTAGGLAVLRGMPRDAAAKRALAAADSQTSMLERRIAQRDSIIDALADSVAALRAPTWNGTAVGDIPELELVTYYTKRGAYSEALNLLAHTRSRLEVRMQNPYDRRWALALIDDHVRQVVDLCYNTRYRPLRERSRTTSGSARTRVVSGAGLPLLLLLSCAAPPPNVRFR